MIQASRPKNKTEAAFYETAKAKQWEVYRGGWPDFLCHRNKKLVAVEVKPDGQLPTVKQLAVMTMLTMAGITCYVWTPSQAYLVLPTGSLEPLVKARSSTASTPMPDTTPSPSVPTNVAFAAGDRMRKLLTLLKNGERKSREIMRMMHAKRPEFEKIVRQSNGLVVEDHRPCRSKNGRPSSVVRLVGNLSRAT